MVSNQAGFTKKDYSVTLGFGFKETSSKTGSVSDTAETQIDVLISTFDRIVNAGFECLAKYGYAKTSMDDIAKEAKCSRATLYRLFPNGKDEIISSLVEKGTTDLFIELESITKSLADLNEAIALVLLVAAKELNGNIALQKVIQCDPEYILPNLVFENMDTILLTAAESGSSLFENWLNRELSLKLTEWLTRIVLTYISSPKGQIKFNDYEAIRDFVKTFIEPGIQLMKLNPRSQNQ
jgi:AcrR family transcriptional regulator